MRMDGIEACTLGAGLEKLPRKVRQDMDYDCDDENIYERVTYLYLLSCNQDGILADAEMDNVRMSIKYIFQQSGLMDLGDDVINDALEQLEGDNAAFYDHTIDILRKYLSKETRKGIIQDCYYMCDADGVDEREGAFLLELYDDLLG